MPISRKVIIPAFFLGAAGLAAGGATVAANILGDRSQTAVTERLAEEGLTFAQARADGLNVHLTGTAPDEATRFRAVSVAGGVVDSARIRDEMSVLPTRAVEAPPFLMEMLRNDEGVSLIGLIPKSSEAMLADTAALVGGGVQVSDMLETADHAAPDTWNAAMNFGIEALKLLPRSKISVGPDHVRVEAIADDAQQKAQFETRLAALASDAITIDIDIAAPRPVLTPFALHVEKGEKASTLQVCSATDESQRDTILAAAEPLGLGDAACTIGLGAPSAQWGDAAVAGLAALARLPQGDLQMSDADILLTGQPGMDRAAFDTVVADLTRALPAGFSLTSTLPPAPEAVAEMADRFTAEVTPTGEARIDGPVRDALGQEAVLSFARAQFGADVVTGEPAVKADVPSGWTKRVLAGLQGLALLEHGTLTVTPDRLDIAGITGSRAAEGEITRLLTQELGDMAGFEVNATYDEDLDPYAALPLPEVCLDRIASAMARQKISFAPGSAEIEGAAYPTLDALTQTLLDCSNLSFEVRGYTDSQGSDAGNQALSQARAEAVMVALQGRRVPAERLTAVGYGEADPIADNATEDGREANRRIEFHLTDVAPDPNAAPLPPEPMPQEPRGAAAAVAGVTGLVLPEEELLSIPAELVDGSGDGDPTATEFDDTPADGEASDAESVDAEPSFAPTEQTDRPERRPEDDN
ncbi:OmpA family protein [Falsirhodobacter halotolerans]|uniref:OmpA family protein n=1 Tax=Falsirhodobacter halotolerans TaxID=1146892 RepID=UPI001FD44717|nr:OmpA family protein [Falsirhodobacter halotolerans]MCJ8138806.1 OmpA family protein [Falsirhodobacter halotolerans]